MTLDEAIVRAENKALTIKTASRIAEYRQLAEWLKELKVRKQLDAAKKRYENRIKVDTEKPTDRQLEYISDIEKRMGIEFDGTTRKQAKAWLNKYAPVYKEEMAIKSVGLLL